MNMRKRLLQTKQNIYENYYNNQLHMNNEVLSPCFKRILWMYKNMIRSCDREIGVFIYFKWDICCICSPILFRCILIQNVLLLLYIYTLYLDQKRQRNSLGYLIGSTIVKTKKKPKKIHIDDIGVFPRINLAHKWIVCIGVVNWISLWQVGDSTE